MARTRRAAGQRTETHRRRGQHPAQSPTVEQVERRGDAHRGAPETTDGLQLLFNEASRYPLLTREEEIELAKGIERGDLEAKERLINSNLRLVIKFARRYQGHGL
ncbi:MAG TPA: sigma-70 factor domain-containing protein, partial [Solirubrobacterales bacterium]